MGDRCFLRMDILGAAAQEDKTEIQLIRIRIYNHQGFSLHFFHQFSQPLLTVLILFKTNGTHEIGSLVRNDQSCPGTDLPQSKHRVQIASKFPPPLSLSWTNAL